MKVINEHFVDFLDNKVRKMTTHTKICWLRTADLCEQIINPWTSILGVKPKRLLKVRNGRNRQVAEAEYHRVSNQGPLIAQTPRSHFKLKTIRRLLNLDLH